MSRRDRERRRPFVDRDRFEIAVVPTEDDLIVALFLRERVSGEIVRVSINPDLLAREGNLATFEGQLRTLRRGSPQLTATSIFICMTRDAGLCEVDPAAIETRGFEPPVPEP